MALYSVRSDRQFCQMLDYNILFRWFLDMSLDDIGLDQSNFSRLRERLVKEDLAQRFFDAIVKVAREEDLLSSRAVSRQSLRSSAAIVAEASIVDDWVARQRMKPS